MYTVYSLVGLKLISKTISLVEERLENFRSKSRVAMNFFYMELFQGQNFVTYLVKLCIHCVRYSYSCKQHLQCKKRAAKSRSRIMPESECMSRLVTARSDIRIWPRGLAYWNTFILQWIHYSSLATVFKV